MEKLTRTGKIPNDLHLVIFTGVVLVVHFRCNDQWVSGPCYLVLVFLHQHRLHVLEGLCLDLKF